MGVSPGIELAPTNLLIRPLREEDLPAADVVRRLAFGTFLGLPDPASSGGDVDRIRPRFLADPVGAVAAELDGELVGTNVVVDWGSLGFFGPLSIHPGHWDRGIAQRLVGAVLEEFGRRGTRHLGLFTFGHSPKHLALYQKFGFWPRFPTAIMAKPVGPSGAGIAWSTYGAFSPEQQQTCLDACRELTDDVYEGLDLGCEITTVAQHDLGETVLLADGDALAGFAICHCGPGTEAGSDTCYVKFGVVRPGPDAGSSFARLLAACEAFTAARGLTRLVAGVNTARREVYCHLLADGFRIEMVGLAMDRPDEAGYNRPGVFVIDDWR